MVLRTIYILLAVPVILANTRLFNGDPGGHFISPLIGVQLCLVHCIYGVSRPLLYMIFPPTVPEREDLVEKACQGINRPKMSAIRGLKVENTFWDIVVDLIFMVTCV